MVGCPSCGAELHFNVDLQKMVCDYCGNQFDLTQISDNSIRDDAKQSYFDSYVYLCPSCGAEIVTTDKNDAVGFCQYCGNQSVIFDKVRKEWAPDGIIPFSVSSEECKQLYVQEAKKYFFVSNKYKKPNQIGAFRGIYMPFWDYEISLNSELSLKADTTEKYVGSNTYESSTYNITGKLNYKAGGYSHDASAAFDDSISEGVAPFNNGGIVDFAPGFLSGFYAEVGDVSPSEYKETIKDQAIEAEAERIINSPKIQNIMAVYGLHLEDENKKLPVDTDNITSVKKIFKPIWFLSYKDKNKITYSAVNGQTGRVAADLPLSPVRILLTSLGVSFLLFLLASFFSIFLPTIKPSNILVVCSELLLFGEFLLYSMFVKTVLKNKIKSKKINNMDAQKKAVFASISNFLLFMRVMFIFVPLLTMLFQAPIYTYTIMPFGLMIFFFVLRLRQYSKLKEIKSEKLKDVNNLRKRIVTEAKKTNTTLIISQVLIYATVLFSVIIASFDLANNLIPYFLCIIQAIELFIVALIHITFQSNIAKRPIPQFNKHGLSSQEENPNA